MNSTPRTDAVCFPVGRMHPDTVVVGVDDCRQLEHELNESNKIIRQQQLLDEENLMLKERIKQLEEALEATAMIIGPPGHSEWATDDEINHAWGLYIQTKEAKL